jgi:hypothetical protein
MQKKIKNAFDWQGPSVYLLDKRMRQIADGTRAGQIASKRAAEKINEKKQVLVYSKGKESANS